KSIDGGQTWTNVGLVESQYIGGIVVDPQNADQVLVAVLGPRPGPGGAVPASAERGVYRSTDGGRNWTCVLPTDGSSGASDVYLDYGDSRFAYALLTGTNAGGAYKSSDGGATWRAVGGSGLPDGARISALTLASGTHGQRLYTLAGVGGGRGGGPRA